LNPRCLG